MAVLSSRSSFRDVRAWYSRLARLERQICRIESSINHPLGTGFLVAPDVVMTAEHVINAASRLGRIQTRFGYAVSERTGNLMEGIPVALAEQDWLINSSPPFGNPPDAYVDIALIRLAQPAGLLSPQGEADFRGWVDLTDGVLNAPENSSLAIMQHPEGGPLKLSLNSQAVLGPDHETGRLMYRTDTLPGSSGSPCFDMDWRFVALHQGRDMRGGNHNHGIPFAMIKAWLEKENLWQLVSLKPPDATQFVVPRQEAGTPAKTQIPMTPELRKLKDTGESKSIEFKNGIAKGVKKVEMSKVLTSVAAFMNSRDGGNVLLGVEDNGNIVGVEDEYPLIDPHSANWDG